MTGASGFGSLVEAPAAALGVELPDLDAQPARLRHEMEDVTCGTT